MLSALAKWAHAVCTTSLSVGVHHYSMRRRMCMHTLVHGEATRAAVLHDGAIALHGQHASVRSTGSCTLRLSAMRGPRTAVLPAHTALR